MNSEIKDIKPVEVWSIFESDASNSASFKSEEKIQEWAVNFGKNLGLETIKR